MSTVAMMIRPKYAESLPVMAERGFDGLREAVTIRPGGEVFHRRNVGGPVEIASISASDSDFGLRWGITPLQR